MSSLSEATLSTSRSHQQREDAKDCRRCYPSRPNPTTCVLGRGSVIGSMCQYSLSSVQCSSSSAAKKGWRSAPDAILPGHRRARQWVPARTPMVHWGADSGETVGGPTSSQQIHGKQSFLKNIFCSFVVFGVFLGGESSKHVQKVRFPIFSRTTVFLVFSVLKKKLKSNNEK